MVDFNQLLRTARTVVFGIVCVLSLADFAIACHILSEIVGFPHSLYLTPAPLGLVTALLSLLTLPVMLWLSASRKGAFTSYVATEVAWCWFLWIMWIATAGSITWVNGRRTRLAREAQAFEAFAFINWLALIFYTTTLLVVATMSHNKGNSVVWTSSVRDFDFNAAVQQSSIPAVAPGPQAQQPDNPPQQPMQQQQPLAPQGSYFPQANYTPHNAGSGFTGPPQAGYQQPVAIV